MVFFYFFYFLIITNFILTVASFLIKERVRKKILEYSDIYFNMFGVYLFTNNNYFSKDYISLLNIVELKYKNFYKQLETFYFFKISLIKEVDYEVLKLRQRLANDFKVKEQKLILRNSKLDKLL